jgi:hypothetical protein
MRELKRLAINLVVWIVAIVLILVWYDWKLLIILMMFGWGSNLENTRKGV